MRKCLAIAFLCAAAPAGAQLIPPGQPIPRREKLPVVFLNGYQQSCAGSSFSATFGAADRVLERTGRAVVFFDNCTVPGRPRIEVLGDAFGTFLRALRYQDGTDVAEVDVVAYSLGGLILRSYLAGKQAEDGVFRPPLETRVRKAVFVAAPHFGTKLTEVLAPDIQVQQIALGSRFLFDLATWNQGADDLRGVDALALLGNAGKGLLQTARFDDGVVSLTSGSLGFAIEGRTRILPYCHTVGGIITFLNVCDSTVSMAAFHDEAHLGARAVVSFLEGTTEWSSIGQSPAANDFLRENGGVAYRWLDAAGRARGIDAGTIFGLPLGVEARQVAYRELIAAQTGRVVLQTAGERHEETTRIDAGYTQARIVKQGPSIARVYPAAAAVPPLVLAPGMFVSIYGAELASSVVDLDGAELPVQFSSDTQINAVLPENAAGLGRLRVRNARGEHTVNIVIERSMPALFTLGPRAAAALNAVTGEVVSQSAPLSPGGYVSLYLTGLGATERRGGLDWAVIEPRVFVGEELCEVLYAGRAPGFRGLDQINCRLSSRQAPHTEAAVRVVSGARQSNVATLAVRGSM